MLTRLRSLFRVLKSRRDFEHGMNEEMRFHLDEHARELERSGMPPEEAARRSRIEFGGIAGVQEDCREARGLRLIDELRRQLRHASRSLIKTPGFTATALITLAVCLGANLTIFAVVDAILLRPLPFPDSDRLVTMFNSYPKAGVDRDGSSTTNYYERRGRIPAFASMAIYRFTTGILGNAGATEREPVARVSPDFFTTLGVGPVIGRGFTEEETSFQTDKMAILTYSYWRQNFNADVPVTGKQIRVDGIPHTVIGVLPPSFRFLSSEARIYLPFSSRPEDRTAMQRHSGGNNKQLIARLKPGATLAQAQAQIDTQNAALEADDPQRKMMADAGFRSLVLPLHADHVAGVRPVLLWIQAGAIMLLLIGAVNLTNLLLIRANNRTKETAVRQALGASRLHVVSETAVETTLLTLAGSLLGLLAGAGGIQLLSVLGAQHLPLGSHVHLDARIACIAVAGALLLGVVLAVPIAWFHLEGHRTNAIQSATRGETSTRAAQGLRHGFIVAQIALALVLLSGAGLLGLSLERAMAVSPGFRPDHVLTGQLSLPPNKYPDGKARLEFHQRLLRDLARQPGVSAVGLVNNIPLSGNTGKSAATVQGHVLEAGESPRGHYSYGVDGDYFDAMGFSLREGRFLSSEDNRRQARVCVVDEDFARYYWPHSSALRQHVFEGSETGSNDQAFTIVGVVGAVKQAGLTDRTAQGAVYYPSAWKDDDNLFVAIRTSLPPQTLGHVLQTRVRKLDPELPVNDLRAMDTRIADSLVAQRSPALLAATFSLIALLLTAVGTYGVLSYAVAQRRREIGVRMALGARPGQIASQFLLLASRLLAAGTILGIAGAWLAARGMRTLLFQVSPFHLLTFAVAAGVIIVISMAACLLPSHRAARISPMEALTSE